MYSTRLAFSPVDVIIPPHVKELPAVARYSFAAHYSFAARYSLFCRQHATTMAPATDPKNTVNTRDCLTRWERASIILRQHATTMAPATDPKNTVNKGLSHEMRKSPQLFCANMPQQWRQKRIPKIHLTRVCLMRWEMALHWYRRKDSNVLEMSHLLLNDIWQLWKQKMRVYHQWDPEYRFARTVLFKKGFWAFKILPLALTGVNVWKCRLCRIWRLCILPSLCLPRRRCYIIEDKICMYLCLLFLCTYILVWTPPPLLPQLSVVLCWGQIYSIREDMFHFQTWAARLAVDVVVSGEGEKSQQQWRLTGSRENTELEDFTGRSHCCVVTAVDVVREEGDKSQQQWRTIGRFQRKHGVRGLYRYRSNAVHLVTRWWG